MIKALGDCNFTDQASAHAWLIENWGASREEVERFEVIVGYEGEVGGWDGEGFYGLREIATGAPFVNTGSHCSCYGFEECWGPEPVTVAYLHTDFEATHNDADEIRAAMREAFPLPEAAA